MFTSKFETKARLAKTLAQSEFADTKETSSRATRYQYRTKFAKPTTKLYRCVVQLLVRGEK